MSVIAVKHFVVNFARLAYMQSIETEEEGKDNWNEIPDLCFEKRKTKEKKKKKDSQIDPMLLLTL